MASTRIENDAWDDPRYVLLAKLCGLSDPDFALIKCARVWSHCTNKCVYVLDGLMVDAVSRIENFAEHMVTAKLATRVRGGYRIHGTKGRIEWLESKRKSGALGGQQKASNRLANATAQASKRLAPPKQKPSETLASDSDSDSDSGSGSRDTNPEEKIESGGGHAQERAPAPPPAPEPSCVVVLEPEFSRKRKPSKRRDPMGEQIVTAATWDAYRVAYTERYGIPPTRNAKVNGQIAHFCQRVPHDEAPDIAAHYLRSNTARYVSAGHAWGPLLQDAEKLRTEWQTGRTTTAYAAQQADRRQGRGEEYERMFERLRAEDEAERQAAQ